MLLNVFIGDEKKVASYLAMTWRGSDDVEELITKKILNQSAFLPIAFIGRTVSTK